MTTLKKLFKKILFPFWWTLSRIGKGLKYVFFDNYYKVFLVILPNFFFSILGASIVIYGFKNIEEDTTNLTNYGFAILAAISSVCFSWTRGLDSTKEPLMIDRIAKAGEGSLHCAIIFLLASALKYSTLHLDVLVPKSWTILYSTLNLTLILIYGTCFTLGFYKVDRIICDINKLLYERLHKGERN
ncbi:MAG: hypothetical protein A2W90_11260 [Bacteroidetes bacterium GWF2_42_66]|nr:MAG: hypothetical protein A2W92_10250 [Bacteroidetes bacterium GWA2_42_15]OFY01845.1 MAG: hypothetical protein A2W89_23310 [Bacteroidetes bacterium GWE2_42_39]OFY44860.1 MAG: hypothetical protein A2W90_11260 [Bacteroidetes bacterium GWF2_42_66]HBL75987.1 hypothetical protein [Prolixibacteraceae bacterium]HCR89967.1 hypothetical protein [Prolixibacteraceae bacterium]